MAAVSWSQGGDNGGNAGGVQLTPSVSIHGTMPPMAAMDSMYTSHASTCEGEI